MIYLKVIHENVSASLEIDKSEKEKKLPLDKVH